MARRFLPSLRTQTPSPAAGGGDHKAILQEYYAALAQAGVYGAHRARPWPVERAVEEGYERVIWCFKAVDAIAGNQSRLPFVLKDGEEEVDDHPLYRLLNDGKANPLETGQQFRKRLSAQILLSKAGAFVEVTTARSGTPKRLDLLPPGRTRIVPGTGNDPIDHFEIVRADGTRRELDPKKVRWFRDPHPIDPYSGITPLEAAGLSVELDYFARAYNATFMKNDGRPGGVIAVKGDMDRGDMDRVESRFGKGAHEAGKLSVINGELTYTDLASKPRDMQYQESTRTSKEEILGAFGTPESVLGFAADRTFANADAEHYNFWTVTMPPHLMLVRTGLDEDSEDELRGDFDTSTIEVLQRAEQNRREEARAEFAGGLITPDEYRERAGYEAVDSPFTRALYIPTGKTPIPTREEDRAALGMAPAGGEGGPQEGTQAEPETPPAAPAGGQQPPPEQGGEPAAPTAPTGPAGGNGAPRSPADAVAAATAPKTLPYTAQHAALTPPAQPVVRIVRPREHKARPGGGKASEPDTDARDELERVVAEVLADVGRRMTDRAIARLESPKTRKHTRHFAPEYPVDTRVGTKALDAARAVDEQRWREEAEQQARPLVDAAATAAAAAVLTDLGLAADAAALASAVAAVVAAIIALIGASAERQARLLITVITDADGAGLDLDDVVARVRIHRDQLDTWAAGLADQVATATSAGARDAAVTTATTVGGGPGTVGGGLTGAQRIVREWRSQRDDRVRASHVLADGQKRGLGEPFDVGGASLRFPGDPLGPWSEVANCRCFLRYRVVATGRFAPRPPGEPLYNPQGRVEPVTAT